MLIGMPGGYVVGDTNGQALAYPIESVSVAK
jgi:hypothetical protein